MNQTRAEEITMREDYGNINLDTVDDGFGEQVRVLNYKMEALHCVCRSEVRRC